ncbi:MAG: hypothetical protein ND866_29685 [Pyrinomonadaceae bacterium]|nr:hypothetical protein [Pyrinomonadaceae bacterium]
MTRTKLSNTSIAAIALFAASVPCFAQTQSTEFRVKESNAVAMASPQLTAPFKTPQLTADEPRFGLLNVKPKSVAAVAPGENSPSLSTAAFMVRMGQVSTLESQYFFGQQTPIYEMGLGNSKKQFRADDDNGGVDQKKRVTFVPSLGQKLPD